MVWCSQATEFTLGVNVYCRDKCKPTGKHTFTMTLAAVQFIDKQKNINPNLYIQIAIVIGRIYTFICHHHIIILISYTYNHAECFPRFCCKCNAVNTYKQLCVKIRVVYVPVASEDRIYNILCYIPHSKIILLNVLNNQSDVTNLAIDSRFD